MSRKLGRLTLTRRIGESIIIDNKIRITVWLTDNVPKLVIEAPREVSILREEMLSADEYALCRENGISLAEKHMEVDLE